MLIAPHTRGLNQAARVAAKYLAELGVTLTHRQVLDLVARTTGAPHHMAAQAALQARQARRAQPTDATLTWDALRHATLLMDDAQLSMPVMVSEGCDDSGNATFAGAQLLLEAQDSRVAAATGDFNGRHPLLLVEPTPEAQDKAPAIIEDLVRVLSHPDLQPALCAQALSDAAYAALASAAPYLGPQALRQLPADVLREAGIECESAQLQPQTQPQASEPLDVTDVDLRRLRAQFEVATGQPFDEVALLERVRRLGLTAALLETEHEHGVSLTLGPNLIFSKNEGGYWSSGFGFVSDPQSATGFGDDAAKHPLSLVNCPDATWVRFDQAPCIDD